MFLQVLMWRLLLELKMVAWPGLGVIGCSWHPLVHLVFQLRSLEPLCTLLWAPRTSMLS